MESVFEVSVLRKRLAAEREERIRLENELDKLEAKLLAFKNAKKPKLDEPVEPDNSALDVLADAAMEPFPQPLGNGRGRPTEFKVLAGNWPLISGDNVATFFLDAGIVLGKALRDKLAEPLIFGDGRIRWSPPEDLSIYLSDVIDANPNIIANGLLELARKFEGDLLFAEKSPMLCCMEFMPAYMGIDSNGWRQNSFLWGRRPLCEGIVIGYNDMQPAEQNKFLNKVDLVKKRYKCGQKQHV